MQGSIIPIVGNVINPPTIDVRFLVQFVGEKFLVVIFDADSLEQCRSLRSDEACRRSEFSVHVRAVKYGDGEPLLLGVNHPPVLDALVRSIGNNLQQLR